MNLYIFWVSYYQNLTRLLYSGSCNTDALHNSNYYNNIAILVSATLLKLKILKFSELYPFSNWAKNQNY